MVCFVAKCQSVGEASSCQKRVFVRASLLILVEIFWAVVSFLVLFTIVGCYYTRCCEFSCHLIVGVPVCLQALPVVEGLLFGVFLDYNYIGNCS